ncbi:MAG TPA: DNA-formamidopyrimidine glycosylase family protein [Fimbriimonadaceae bacterium]|nr:DNA-formamidopyrimidine glycosylase family protein [Fimbriimonadaceae bacterium]
MPELPEVETVRRTLAAALKGKIVRRAEFPEDSIVQSKLPPTALVQAVEGARVLDVHRKGKYWWIELDRKPWLFGHLGMAGWIREIGRESIRLREHGKAPWEDAEGNVRFLKMRLVADDGREVVMTDGRRLARLWLAEGPHASKNVAALGHDVLDHPWTVDELHAVLSKRQAPIKALLLDQSLFAGVGNWIADEALFQAGIRPSRAASTLTRKEIGRMLEVLAEIVGCAVECGADSSKYPASWLFMHRWGGKKGVDELDGHPIRREPIGGRTTAWVPDLQR